MDTIHSCNSIASNNIGTAVEIEPVPAHFLTCRESQRLVALESVIKSGLQTFVEVGEALMEIRDSRLYRIEHGTFEAYCLEKWDLKQSRAYQLMDAAKVSENLKSSTIVELPQTESQARPLTKLPAEQQPIAWARAVENAGGEQPTAKQVKVAVLEVLPPLVEPEKKKRNPNIRFFHRVKISLSGEIISLEKIENTGSENDSYIMVNVISDLSINYSLETIRKKSFAGNVCKAMRNLIREEARP